MTSNSDTKQSPEKDASIEGELYKKKEKLYVREVHGIWATMRNVAMAVLLGLYYGMAWISWNGQQIVLFDLPNRKFHLFGFTFWPQDFIYLSALLIIAALALFMFTAIAGRLWCGYACPQTVWTEIYMWIERMIEGDSRKRKKLDKAERDFTFYRIKATKHLAWAVFSLWTGFTFVGYFTPIRELADSLLAWNLGPWETFWILFYGAATHGNAGFMREQVCIYMCPYARFQSAMIDKDTMIISYDEKRGDPRGARKRGTDPKSIGKGDCIDCGLCVQVCPTGIDIRNGLQYQCIGCAACIDVCDEVMGKMGYDKGLIKYTTESALEGKEVKVIRPRVLVYVGIISTVSLLLFYALLTRVPLEVDILRDRSALFNENRQGQIENVYTLKVINMDKDTHEYQIEVDGLDGIAIQGDKTVTVRSGEVVDLPMRVEANPESIKERSSEIHFHFKTTDGSGIELREPARFLGPVWR